MSDNSTKVITGILSKYIQGGHTFAVQQLLHGIAEDDKGYAAEEDSLLTFIMETPLEKGGPTLEEVHMGGIMEAAISGHFNTTGFVSAKGDRVMESCPQDSQVKNYTSLGPYDLYNALTIAGESDDPNLVRATTTWRSVVVDRLVERELLEMEGHEPTAPARELDLLEVVRDLQDVQRKVGAKRVREEEPVVVEEPYRSIHPHSIGIIPGEPQPPRRRVTTTTTQPPRRHVTTRTSATSATTTTTTTTTSSVAPKSSALRILESMTPLPGTTRYINSFDEVGVDVRGRSVSPNQEVYSVSSGDGSTITSPSRSQPQQPQYPQCWYPTDAHREHNAIRRRHAFSAAEDKAILEGVLRFYGTSRFADIFSAYKAVWQPGRTPTGLYDHWRAKLRSKAVDHL